MSLSKFENNIKSQFHLTYQKIAKREKILEIGRKVISQLEV